MDCRTTSAHKFRTRLGFKQYDVVIRKEQSVPEQIMSSFEEEKMQTQYNALTYRIDLYFHDSKSAVEIDENGYSDRNTDHEIKRQKAIEKELEKSKKFIVKKYYLIISSIGNLLNQLWKVLQRKIQGLEKLNTIDYCVYRILLFVRKNWF